MKTRLLAIGLAGLSAALVACGGGGGGGGGTPPTAPPSISPTNTPTPTPSPTPASFGCVGVAPFAKPASHAMAAPYPVGAGDQFSYTGTLQETYAQSAPCPQPTATTNAQVSITASDAATTAPSGNSGSTDTMTETDAFPTHTTNTATALLTEITGSKALLYSTTSSDGTGNKVVKSYTNPQEFYDLGAGTSWTNNPAASIAETVSDGTAISRTLASDGSYTETDTFPTGTAATITVNGAANGKTLDGSGVYSFAGATFAYAAPAGGNITLTITSGTSSKTRTFPAWFTVPASGAYVTDSFSDNGLKAFDPSCSVPASFGTTGNQVVETYSVLDPILGYTETLTTTAYDDAGYGSTCIVISDTLKSYYDYSNDTTRIDYQSVNGQPNSVKTISETLTMQTAACGSGSPPCAQARTTQSRPVSAAAVYARIAAIEHYRAVERAKRLNALHAFALRYLHLGGQAR